MSHLDTVNARWKYDVMWAAGLYSTYDLFFSAIDEKTREVCCPVVFLGNSRQQKAQSCSCFRASLQTLAAHHARVRMLDLVNPRA